MKNRCGKFGTMCRFFFILFVFMTVLPAFAGPLQASAQEYVPDRTPVRECGDYAYKVYNDGTVEIVEYSGQEADVVIPAELDGLRVTMVGSQAFAYYEMASLTIPEGISVSGRAFEYCTITDALALPAGIDIRLRAFEYASLPKAVMIPEGAVVGGDSFSYCENLETLFVEPTAVVKDSAFSYSEDLKTLICASGSEIADRAFYSSRPLSEILLCGDVKLGDKPFPYCGNARMLPEEEERYVLEAEKVFGLRGKPDGTGLTSGPTGQETGRIIGKEPALIAALDDAGLRPREISSVEIELKQDRRGEYYGIIFRHGNYGYEYEIDARTGEILSAKKAK